MNKIIIAIVVIAIIIVGGYFLLNNSQPSTQSNSVPQQPMQETPSAPSPTTQAPTAETPAAQNVVTYEGSRFSPNVLRVKAGATVTFKNESSDPMWVASNPHPIHTDYPGFDAKRGYAKGESYSFAFTKLGSWKYHNHLNPGEDGTIIVE